MKKYFIMTFGCQMNYADSEKVNMLLLQSGFMITKDWRDADLIIFNTCSVRKKGEDRVFGIYEEIQKEKERLEKLGTPKRFVIGITGCMVRKSGVNEKYFNSEGKKRERAKKIEYIKDENSLLNNDDKLFPRMPNLDFVFRIEEVNYLNKILTTIFDEQIGNDHKFDDYLKSKQLRENSSSASVIIQKGCDNFCTFCIVPYTRDREISRDSSEILNEIKEAAKSGATEVTLLGQNVNSYGKQFNKALWNEEKSAWNKKKTLNIGIDLDDSLIQVWYDKILEKYNNKYNDNLKFSDISSHNFDGNENLKNIFFEFYYDNFFDAKFYNGGKEVLKKLKKDGHNLYVITSRPETDIEITNKYLENHFGKDFFANMIFVKKFGEDKKCTFANLHKLDFVIEDAPHHIENYLKNTNCEVIVFSQNWNKNISLENNLERYDDWEKIYERINKSNKFKSPFRKLLEEVSDIDGIKRIRFTSSNPHDMTADILDAHFELPNMCNYLHFALQSGNDEILKKMNRRHKYEEFKRIVKYLREKDPLFSISTDIIVGFSGETEEQFQDTLKAIEELEFDFVYIARYSVRTGTIASKIYQDDVTSEEKARRWHILNGVLEKNVAKRNALMLGRVEEILISGIKGDEFVGRTRNFKELQFPYNENYKVGDLVNVKITELDKWVLKGEIV